MSDNSRHFKFKDLPPSVQERLLGSLRGEGDNLVFQTGGGYAAFLIVAAAIVWFGVVFYLTDDYLWSQEKLVLIAAVSFIAFYFLLPNFWKIIRRFASPLKNSLVISRQSVVEIDSNTVRLSSLEQLAAPASRHVYSNGKYAKTIVTLRLENEQPKTLEIKNLDQAEETIERIFRYKKLYAEAEAKNDRDYFDSNDDFAELKNQSRRARSFVENKNLKIVVNAAAVLALTAGTIYAASKLNNFYDDRRSWNDAVAANHAQSFRGYLLTHRNGRWAAEAKQKLSDFYELAKRNYQTSLNKGFDPRAAETILRVLEHAEKTQNYQVRVGFARQIDISPNIAEELKKEFEVKNVLPIGSAFADEQMKRRESNLLAIVADAFRRIVPEDVLEFVNECGNECAAFAVRYKVGAADLYYDLRQEDLSDDARTFYPGIWIDWNFDIEIPNQPENYNFALESNPASEISYDSNFEEAPIGENGDFSKVLDRDKNYIYDSMVASAFDDFKKNLVYRMGIGEPPQNDEQNDKAVNGSEIKSLSKEKK